jgi:hypothetical protein
MRDKQVTQKEWDKLRQMDIDAKSYRTELISKQARFNGKHQVLDEAMEKIKKLEDNMAKYTMVNLEDILAILKEMKKEK